MTTLADFHQSRAATWGERGARSHVLSYGSATDEAAAARETCGLVDRSARGKVRLTGAERIQFAQGMVTNDVKKHAPGGGCYAAILTPKGKMVADCRILVRADHLLFDVEPERAAAVNEFLASHVISEDVEVAEVSAELAILSVVGPRARDAIAALSADAGAKANGLTENAHAEVGLPQGPALLVSASVGGLAGYDLIVPMPVAGGLAAAWVDAAKGVGLRPIGFEALESVRIEQGVPRYGPDMDEETIPLEAGITERAISFEKGCYVGQETIARVAHRGHVNRNLVRLRFDGGEPRPGASLASEEDSTPVGTVTSVATVSGLSVGLGYVRSESAKEGTRLKTGSGAAVVVGLAH